ncbi:hypothetical protein G9A89_014339 [Geosiphon pyriformis]|nr:hypothetical protein G9A89_014339 [Geosiphon pyriformis]
MLLKEMNTICWVKLNNSNWKREDALHSIIVPVTDERILQMLYYMAFKAHEISCIDENAKGNMQIGHDVFVSLPQTLAFFDSAVAPNLRKKNVIGGQNRILECFETDKNFLKARKSFAFVGHSFGGASAITRLFIYRVTNADDWVSSFPKNKDGFKYTHLTPEYWSPLQEDCDCIGTEVSKINEDTRPPAYPRVYKCWKLRGE